MYSPPRATWTVMRLIWMQIALCTAIILEAAIMNKRSLARVFELTYNNIFQRGEVWQLLTSTLVHANPFQLLFNALTLWMFGSELEQRWGRHAPAVWPAPDYAAPPRITPLQCSPDDRPIHLLIDRFDFTPLIRWRTAANRRWGHRLGEPIPLPAVLIWHLAQQPAFAGRKPDTTEENIQSRARGVILMD